jgi:hypothetical protein
MGDNNDTENEGINASFRNAECDNSGLNAFVTALIINFCIFIYTQI